MKRRKQQIMRGAEAGSPIKAVCAAHNIRGTTDHAWKRTFRRDGGQRGEVAERLGRGNSRLKRLVADQAVHIHIFKEVSAKKR
jgi:transposase-like protein